MNRQELSPGQDALTRANQRRRVPWQPLLFILAIVLIVVLGRIYDLAHYLQGFRSWIEQLGPWGPIVFIILYAILVTLALPGSALTILAGALFGSLLGVIVVSIAATLGAAFSFLIARYLAREATAQWLAGNERFRRLDELTERYGAIIVAITRLIPLFPFNLLNYSFGLTRVPFWTYLFWSWLCMLPGTILYVVGADAIMQLVSEGEVPGMLFALLAFFAALLFLLGWIARRNLRSKVEADSASALEKSETDGGL
ncbi:MAG TPA: TVP38/TMEM64 family protein [Acidobacteriota bacterium]|nr:TVP38/TMEM64 family protein [Acidobacteriota bacterium]